MKLAIFDIDGTIFRSSLFIELFNELVKRGVFPLTARAQVERDYTLWLNRQGHYNGYLHKMVRVFYRYLKGRTRMQVEPAVQAVIRNQKDRVYRYTRDLIQQLKHDGYYVLAISNTMDTIVDHFAVKMGIDASVGRAHELKNDIYTGRTMYQGKPMGPLSLLDKVDVLNDFIRSRSLQINLKQAVAVGDSEGDIALLSAVGHPIAFNPSRILAEVAKKKKWPIIVERKDVIYHVKSYTLKS